jgi:excisionase family DNA binding protein
MGAAVSVKVEIEELLTPAETAALFKVDVRTVTEWANAGKITAYRTVGGHRRYRKAEVMADRALAEDLMTPIEVAHLFRVDSRTVRRWAEEGKLTAYPTRGGHRRYRKAEVMAHLAPAEPEQPS